MVALGSIPQVSHVREDIHVFFPKRLTSVYLMVRPLFHATKIPQRRSTRCHRSQFVYSDLMINTIRIWPCLCAKYFTGSPGGFCLVSFPKRCGPGPNLHTFKLIGSIVAGGCKMR